LASELMTNRDEYIEKLAKVAKMTPDEAKKALLDEVQSDLTGEIAKKIRAPGRFSLMP